MFCRPIYENSPDAILLTAPDVAIIEANPAVLPIEAFSEHPR